MKDLILFYQIIMKLKEFSTRGIMWVSSLSNLYIYIYMIVILKTNCWSGYHYISHIISWECTCNIFINYTSCRNIYPDNSCMDFYSHWKQIFLLLLFYIILCCLLYVFSIRSIYVMSKRNTCKIAMCEIDMNFPWYLSC